MPSHRITRVQLCGQIAVVADGVRVEDALPGRQGRLVFGYLSSHRQRPVSRDELLDVLWPDAVSSSSSATLTVLLSKIRAVLGSDALHGRGTLQLHLPAAAVIDTEVAAASVHEAESASSLGEWQRAWGPALTAHLIAKRPFLLGHDGAWIDEERTRLELIHARALACYAQASLGIGGTELPGAERAARELIRVAPLSETGYRLLMRALAAYGDTASALQTYERLRRILHEELGILPGQEARDLHQQLLTQRPSSVLPR